MRRFGREFGTWLFDMLPLIVVGMFAMFLVFTADFYVDSNRLDRGYMTNEELEFIESTEERFPNQKLQFRVRHPFTSHLKQPFHCNVRFE